MSEPIDKDLGLDVEVQPASITIEEESDRDLEKRIRIFLFGRETTHLSRKRQDAGHDGATEEDRCQQPASLDLLRGL